MLSLITTCKNRLPHLKQTLPLMLQQPRAEVIVVDYGCEQGTAAWVKEHHPQAKLIEVNDDPIFSVARARNIGAENASHEILCFVDADVMIHFELGEWLEINHDPNRFYLYPDEKQKFDLCGFVIVVRKHFFKVEGYDEAFRGWGAEDNDLYERLARTGLSESRIPSGSISAIPHGDELRQVDKNSGGFGSINENMSMLELYQAIKRDTWHLTGRNVELEKRKELLQYIKMLREEAIKREEATFEISINIPVSLKHNRHLKGHRWLNYKMPVGQPIDGVKPGGG
jgi:glycosyltransferase involved in cell wall biosynthesis